MHVWVSMHWYLSLEQVKVAIETETGIEIAVSNSITTRIGSAYMQRYTTYLLVEESFCSLEKKRKMKNCGTLIIILAIKVITTHETLLKCYWTHETLLDA